MTQEECFKIAIRNAQAAVQSARERKRQAAADKKIDPQRRLLGGLSAAWITSTAMNRGKPSRKRDWTMLLIQSNLAADKEFRRCLSPLK